MKFWVWMDVRFQHWIEVWMWQYFLTSLKMNRWKKDFWESFQIHKVEFVDSGGQFKLKHWALDPVIFTGGRVSRSNCRSHKVVIVSRRGTNWERGGDDMKLRVTFKFICILVTKMRWLLWIGLVGFQTTQRTWWSLWGLEQSMNDVTCIKFGKLVWNLANPKFGTWSKNICIISLSNCGGLNKFAPFKDANFSSE